MLDLAGRLFRSVKTIRFVTQHGITDVKCGRIGGADAAD
jgi:hypothetical protein